MPDVAEAPDVIEEAPATGASETSTAQAEPAANESATATATKPSEVADTSDADYAAWKKDQDEPETDDAIDPLETKQQKRDEVTGQFKPKGDKPTAPLIDLDPEDAALLKRRGIEPDDLPVDLVKREKFLRRQYEKQVETDRAFQNFRQGKAPEGEQSADPTKQTGQPNQPASSAPADLDKAWGGMGEALFTDDGPKVLRETVEATARSIIQQELQRATNPAQGDVNRVVQHLANREFKTALAEWTPPEGVDLSNPEVDKKIRAKADRLAQIQIQDGTHPLDLDFRQLAHDAASLEFPNKNQATDQRRAAAIRARKGSAESGVRTPTTQAPSNEDQLESQWFKDHPRK